MAKDVDSENTELVDSHCHIDLMKNPSSEVHEAEAAKIHTIAVTNAPSVFFHTRDLCRRKEFIHAALGLHPELVHSHGGEFKRFEDQIAETRFVGEIGLDYVTTDQALRKRQRDIFDAILKCCSDAGGKVLTVHSRRSASDVIAALGRGSGNSPILHWFSGTRRELDRAVDIGCHFSLNTSMRTSKSGLSLLAAMPRERVITETDGPFVQLGGKPCTPKDVKSATQLLSNAWGIPFVETANAVLDNFLKLIA